MTSAPISMDVNLTISLMRGQMGAVIEKAVNVAVETVLGEMIRVVGLKFEEIKREMTAKEKENENIRRMLETSRCQMKTMRKYMSVIAAKDPNHRPYQTEGDMAASSPGLHGRRAPTSTVSVCAKPQYPCPRPRVTVPGPVAGPSWARQQQLHMSKETPRNDNHLADLHIEEIHGPSPAHKVVENSNPHLIDSQGLLSETSDPIWGQNPLASADARHTDMPDSSVLSAPMMVDESMPSQTTNTVAFGSPLLKIKQEDAEVEIVCVKDEPGESGSTSRLEYPNAELHHQVGEPEFGVPLDLPTPFQTLQSPGTSADLAIPAFMGMDPSTYPLMANASAEKQRAYRRRRDADPARREKYLMNERERWRRDIETGKRKRIGDLGEKAQIMRRKQWREAKERQKRRFFKIIASPERSPEASLMALLNNQDVPSAWTNHQRPYPGQFRLKNEVVNNKVHQLGDPVK
ncbi:uncharacterized protein si:ch211-67e16.4 isoform X4 [Danio aesculapii]|uniref:uncharacterized protein si:ch211-67e16.4 isoform X4 n=1 Tax=Danio aesculapii TaxID=1142201 RepID=UPI0024BFCB37|nr:uncharacterized protein si:ch211-67e16.4 isoform X4 [Danio aesculapii]